MPKKTHSVHIFNKLTTSNFMLLMVVQVVLIFFLVGQSILYQGYQLQNISDAAEKFKDYTVHLQQIGSKVYTLYVADSDEKRTQGLSGIRSMNDHEGMVFQFDSPARYSFWMKNMHFPLDFIFVQDDTVVNIYTGVHPDSFPARIEPDIPADFVIELNSGEVEQNGISVGDVLP